MKREPFLPVPGPFKWLDWTEPYGLPHPHQERSKWLALIAEDWTFTFQTCQQRGHKMGVPYGPIGV